MALEFTFVVGRVQRIPMEAEVEYQGHKTLASVNALEVHLHDESGRHGNPMLRFYRPDEVKEAEAVLVHGARVTVSLTAAAPAPEATPASA